MSSPTAFVVGRGVDLETAVAVKDLALRMGTAAVYKEGGIAGEDYPNHLKLTDVDEVNNYTHAKHVLLLFTPHTLFRFDRIDGVYCGYYTKLWRACS